ncbi:MAG: GspE/PulE family protein [Kiritimatiellia bacterium]
MSGASPGLPALDRIQEEWLDPALVDSVPVDWVRRHALVPFRRNGQVAIAGAETSSIQAYEDLALLLGVEAVWMTAPAAEIQRAIDRCYFRRAGPAGGAAAVPVPPGGEAPARREADDLLAGSADAPVAQYVNSILLEAVKHGASDIHIEPFVGGLAVRYRIDGLLYAQPPPPRHVENALTARLKVMAKLDLAEKRLPQDGVARVRVGAREIDVRVSSVPVAEGERIVLRLLHRESIRYALGELGMSPAMLGEFRGILREPHGVVLVTGPTGSGKTTTLYAALRELDTAHLNVLTIEDPIEYQLPNIGQMQVHPKIGLTFARGLRHVLRQDPDVVLVGETRDLETAEIVVRASLTGHLVFTTLHTNDAIGAVSRMVDMGIPAYLLAAATRAVLAQRLVRRLCPHCRRETPLSAADAALLGQPGWAGRSVWEAAPKGCAECLGGYKGRTGIHELLTATPAISEAVRTGAPPAELRRLAVASGFRDMLDDGADKILAGITSVAEVLRSAGARKE